MYSDLVYVRLPIGDERSYYATPVDHLKNAKLYINDLLGNPLSSLNLLKMYNYKKYLETRSKAIAIKKDIDSMI